MNHKILLSIVAVGLLAGSLSFGKAKAPVKKPVKKPAPKPMKLDGANWIWWSGEKGNPAANAPACTRYFRKSFDLPGDVKTASARVIITTDNLFTLYVNNKEVAKNDSAPDDWSFPQTIDISDKLMSGHNLMVVKAANTAAGPAGLIVKMVASFGGSKNLTVVTDGTWKSIDKPAKDWHIIDFDESQWTKAKVLGRYGIGPWGTRPSGGGRRAPVRRAPVKYEKITDFSGPVFEKGVVFVRGYISHGSHDRNNYIQNVRRSRAYFESDTPSPAALGRQLIALVPLGPNGKATLLADAKGGMIGSPSVSYDGKTIYFSMAPKGEAYYHVYSVSPDGSNLKQITAGPFHDFDPTELPDGRIAFSSTRIGSREEYHGVYAFSLFACDKKGQNVEPITQHIVQDREPRVTADGALAFIRGDNFFERAKVETQIHQTRIDGSAGVTILGPGRKPIAYSRYEAAEANSNWLRKHGFGSPAPMANGKVAAISQRGLVVSSRQIGDPIAPGGFIPYDFSPAGDGRFICTGISKQQIVILDPDKQTVAMAATISEMELPDPSPENASRGYSSGLLHSVMHLGPRKKPITPPSMIDPAAAKRVDKTGFLFCQNARNTLHQSADISRIKAIRVFEGRPFTLNSTKHIYVHLGVEAQELGTAPLAPDGSFYIEVPADRALALQAIDGEGRAVINEITWIYTRPGEQRACVGCHTPADTITPAATRSMALRGRPLKLTGQGDRHRYRGNNGANGGVLNLQFDKFREVTGISQFVQEPLTPSQAAKPIPSGRKQDLDRLLALAGSKSVDERLSAVRRLGLMRDRRANEVLTAALKDDSDEVRVAAAMSLSACGTFKQIAPLSAALSDKHPLVAQGANVALEHLTGHSTEFNAYDSDRPAQTAKWTAWLKTNSREKIETSAIAKLASKDAAEVQMAMETLGHIGRAPAAAALRGWLAKNPDAELRLMMAAMRSLGYLKDTGAIKLLAGILDANTLKKIGRGHHEFGFQQKPVYLAATSAEALGWIGTEASEKALAASMAKLTHFWNYSFRSGEHSWLMGCTPSAVHYRILEAFDAMATTDTKALTDKIARSIPIDTDRALLFEPDAYELLTSRVVQRSGMTSTVVETCLTVLGDKSVKGDPALKTAVTASPPASSTKPLAAEPRAAQVLSVVCMSRKYAPNIREALVRFRAAPESRKRSWTCFFLTRALSKLRDPGSADALLDVINKDPAEAKLGMNPPPTHIMYKAMKPFYRATAAHALGRIGDAKAADALMKIVQDFDNAPCVRQQAAVALGQICDKTHLDKIKSIAENYPELASQRSLLEACKAIERRGR
ncbi:MAG: HEAT repeat domain-containing protein [Phycisphaerae bacterium]|jgi:HEAT repeat protein|nr:HEAT repeat domain-containing protein [Phycisphaerae bacterium]